MKSILQNEVAGWAQNRNKAIHEMMKIAVGDNRTWKQRLAENERTATDGLALLRKIDGRLRQLKAATQHASRGKQSQA